MTRSKRPPKDPASPGVGETRQDAFTPDVQGAPAAKRKTGLRLKVRKIGNSLGVVLPKDVLAKLRVGEGDMLSVTAGDGEARIARCDDDTAELMALAEGIMRKRRKVLKALAR